MGRASWTGVGSVVRADRKVGGTVETPARYQGGRESKSCLCNTLPPLVPTTGETACPTLGFMTLRGPQAHCDRAEAPPHIRSMQITTRLQLVSPAVLQCRRIALLDQFTAAEVTPNTQVRIGASAYWMPL